jgi:hypothetical protein
MDVPRAHTTEVLTWRVDRAMLDMPSGTELEVSPLRPEDTKDQENRIGCVAVEWMGRRRFVPASALAADDVEAARTLQGARAGAAREAQRKRREADKEGR